MIVGAALARDQTKCEVWRSDEGQAFGGAFIMHKTRKQIRADCDVVGIDLIVLYCGSFDLFGILLILPPSAVWLSTCSHFC